MLSNFFQPDDEMSKFIINLAQERTIIDVGCCTGHVLAQIKKNGYDNFIGLEPFTPFDLFNHTVAHRILPIEVSSAASSKMIRAIAHRSMVILCRPCHNQELICGTFDLCKELDMDLYYIGLRKNIERDLDMNDIKYDLIPHTGSSKDNEIILKLS